MTSSLRYAAVALCAALALTACTKSSQTTTTDATQTAAPDTTQGAGSTAAPDATATDAAAAPGATTPASAPPGTTTTTSTSTTNGSGGASTGYVDLPVYPGSTETKNQELSMASNGNSVVIKVYTTNDDGAKVTNWYKSNLPSAWKNEILSSDGKTTGTFSNEMSDGDQSVIVTPDGTNTRIQLATKHGK
jgi:hypothetical protein